MKLTLIIGIILLGLKLHGQEKLYTYLDVAPTGRQNYLPYEGGSELMIIDWTTPLTKLVDRLHGNWRLSQTGKGYWIGYTNDMFSIAARNDTAIYNLQKLIDTSNNIRARIGAIYCLHLIGIDRRIAGRFIEKFVNEKARMALLYSLKYEELQTEIMKLLIRDPRMSDVPFICAALKNYKGDGWALVNGLLIYRLPKYPIRQDIPDKFEKLAVQIKYSRPNGWDSGFNFKAHWLEILEAIESKYNSFIVIEPQLFTIDIHPNVRYKFVIRPNGDGKTVFISDFLYTLTGADYCSIGNNLYTYYVDDEKIYICSMMTAKQKVLDWCKM